MAKKKKNRKHYKSANYHKKGSGHSKTSNQRRTINDEYVQKTSNSSNKPKNNSSNVNKKRVNNSNSSVNRYNSKSPTKRTDKYKTTTSSKNYQTKKPDFTRTSKYKAINQKSTIKKDLNQTKKYKPIDELTEEKINSIKKDLDRIIEKKAARESYNKTSELNRNHSKTKKYQSNISYNKRNNVNKTSFEDKKTSHANSSTQLLKDRLMEELNNPKPESIKSTKVEALPLKDKPKPPKKKRKLRKKVKLLIALLAFVASILLILLYVVYHDETKHQPKKVKEEETPIIEKDPKLEEMEKLYQENNDLVGWIKIDGTKIDYPVVYTKGEDYYLRRDFYKNNYEAGTLMVDKFNTVTPRDTNLIIHGHNMNDGTMFHDLLNYKNEAYYQQHKKITYYTLEEKQEYEIMAVFLSRVYRVKDQVFKYYKFYNATNESEYKYYIDNVKRLSLYDTGITSCFNNELLTLSTCEYSQANGRLVVVARKVSENNNCQ